MSHHLRVGQKTAPAAMAPYTEPKMGDRPVTIVCHSGRMDGVSKKLLLGAVFATKFAVADAKWISRENDHSSYATGGLIMTAFLVATFAGYFCVFYRRS